MSRVSQQQKAKFHLRQCVKVKPGVKDPDFNVEIGGWQGRIADFDRSVAPPIYQIVWDSVTLREMSLELIVASEEAGLAWDGIFLYEDELEAALPRDEDVDVEEMLIEIEDDLTLKFSRLANTPV